MAQQPQPEEAMKRTMAVWPLANAPATNESKLAAVSAVVYSWTVLGTPGAVVAVASCGPAFTNKPPLV